MSNRLFRIGTAFLIFVIISSLIVAIVYLPPTDISKIRSDDGGYLGMHLKVVQIEGCEYFYSPSGTNCPMLCHKGNCKNPIHQK